MTTPSPGGRFLLDNHKVCPECGRTVTFTGGWFRDFATYQEHLTEVAAQHGIDYFDDHPGLHSLTLDDITGDPK